MKLISCLFLAGLATLAVAKSLEYDELVDELRRMLDEAEEENVGSDVSMTLQHEERVGDDDLDRSLLETRGKKKKGGKKKGGGGTGGKKKKGGKKKGGNTGGTGGGNNDGTDNETPGNTGGGKPDTDNTMPKPPAGVTQHPAVSIFKGGKESLMPVEESILNAHNFVRKIHGVVPLVWDQGLARTAQAHADVVAAAGKIFHSDTQKGGYGENVGVKSISVEGTVYTPSFIVFNWYIECRDYKYNFNSEKNDARAGHFTQVVWGGTKKVGCGVSSSKVSGMDSTYVVCQYLPPGNYLGQYMKNVNANSEPIPTKPITLHKEGCADYCPICGNYKSFCEKYDFVKDTCCDTCK